MAFPRSGNLHERDPEISCSFAALRYILDPRSAVSFASLVGDDGEERTPGRDDKGNTRPRDRLLLPEHYRKDFAGGTSRIRTGVQAFAELCLTTRPSRHPVGGAFNTFPRRNLEDFPVQRGGCSYRISSNVPRVIRSPEF